MGEELQNDCREVWDLQHEWAANGQWVPWLNLFLLSVLVGLSGTVTGVYPYPQLHCLLVCRPETDYLFS